MTPFLWHEIANRVKPFKRKLVFGAAIGFTATATFFSIALNYQLPDKWLFLSLWLSAVLTFWCFGLLQLVSHYSVLPVKSSGVLADLRYYLHIGFCWFEALFMTVWFVGLSFATFVAPVLILYSPKS